MRCLDQCPAMNMTCFCPNLPAREAIGCFPSSASKPLSVLPKLFSLFRKQGGKAGGTGGVTATLEKKNGKRGALALEE